MPDGRANNGGHRTAGRKSKAEERKLLETLEPMHADWEKHFHKAVKSGESWALKMYAEYYYGKPKQMQELVIKNDTPLKIENYTPLTNGRRKTDNNSN